MAEREVDEDGQTGPLCVACQRAKLKAGEPQTCPACVAATRRELIAIESMYATLPAELTERAGAATPPDPGRRGDSDGAPLPGGDIMVLLGPGSTRWHVKMPDGRADKGDLDAADIDDAADSVLGFLERWESDWRIALGDRAADDLATISGCMVYLLRRLEQAAQRVPTFGEFVTQVRGLHRYMEQMLRCAPQRTRVPCLTCGARALERPAPRDDGRLFEWQCGKCHRNYTQEEFWMAVRQHGEAV